ncbi:MAG TPA: hypothetical protein VF376_10685 [Thermoanaerobaculia bacterium]
MSFLRLLLALLILAFGYWLVTKSGLLHRGEEAVPAEAPIERARAAARASEQRNAQTAGAQREADAPANPGTVTENMTPDQVRGLLGPPSDVRTETTDSGARRERWVYSTVGKTVVFENGVVVSVE